MRTVLIGKTEYFPIFEAGLFGEGKSANNANYYRKRHAEKRPASEFEEMLKSEIKFVALS